MICGTMIIVIGFALASSGSMSDNLKNAGYGLGDVNSRSCTIFSEEIKVPTSSHPLRKIISLLIYSCYELQRSNN